MIEYVSVDLQYYYLVSVLPIFQKHAMIIWYYIHPWK